MAVPAVSAVTNPVVGSTVATAVLLLLQLPPVTVEVYVAVDAIQMFWLPLNVPAVSAAVTVTVRVAVASGHPPVPVTVYVMTDVPAANAVTKPVVGSTVATAVLLLLQLPPATVDVYVAVDAMQMFWLPLKVPALGGAVTVTVRVAVAAGHPPEPAIV